MLTYVGAWDDKQMAAAIRRELLRDGQVFVIHNRVQSIDKAAAKIRNLVPEARVAVGHGQMKEHELERIMVGFWEKEYDVLVATTIVESGLDIPNANTLIVDRADTFGLSQLHQIRGPGRPWPRAGLRLLHLRPDAAADRDLGRPADHDRAQHRPRRRHGGGDEGPRDPRLGQPARRRAVRAHRRRRLRPLRPARRRGGRGLPRAGQRRVRAGRARRGPGGPAGRRAPAARLRPRRAAADGGLPQGGLGAGRRPGAGRARRAHRPLRRPAGPGAQPARRRPVPDARCARSASPRCRCRAGRSGSARCALPRVASRCGWPASPTGASYKAAVETISLKVPVGPDRRTPLRDVALLENLHVGAARRPSSSRSPQRPEHRSPAIWSPDHVSGAIVVTARIASACGSLADRAEASRSPGARDRVPPRRRGVRADRLPDRPERRRLRRRRRR